MRPAPRSGVSVAVAANGKAYIFGGVLDTDEDEERLEGQFTNEMHMLELSNQVWRLVELKKRSVKSKDKATEEEQGMDTAEKKSVSTDGVFTMTVGGSNSTPASKSKAAETAFNVPSPRMKPGVAIVKGNLYLFGGEVENGPKQYTLNDFYSLGENDSMRLSRVDVLR